MGFMRERRVPVRWDRSRRALPGCPVSFWTPVLKATCHGSHAAITWQVTPPPPPPPSGHLPAPSSKQTHACFSSGGCMAVAPLRSNKSTYCLSSCTSSGSLPEDSIPWAELNEHVHNRIQGRQMRHGIRWRPRLRANRVRASTTSERAATGARLLLLILPFLAIPRPRHAPWVAFLPIRRLSFGWSPAINISVALWEGPLFSVRCRKWALAARRLPTSLLSVVCWLETKMHLTRRRAGSVSSANDGPTMDAAEIFNARQPLHACHWSRGFFLPLLLVVDCPLPCGSSIMGDCSLLHAILGRDMRPRWLEKYYRGVEHPQQPRQRHQTMLNDFTR